MIGLLLLSRVVVLPAPFFLQDPHTMMQTNQVRKLWPRLKVRPRQPQTPQVLLPRAPRVQQHVSAVSLCSAIQRAFDSALYCISAEWICMVCSSRRSMF